MGSLNYIIIYLVVLAVIAIIVAILFKAKSKKDDGSEDESTSHASPLELAAQEALRKQVANRGMMYFLGFITSILALGLAKLWEWWFKPKKVATTGGIIIVAAGIFSYFMITTVSGDIFVNVTDFYQIPPKNIADITVVIKAFDKATNVPITDIKFTSKDEMIKGQEHSITLSTNKDGIATTSYKGRFKPENAVLQISIITKGTKYDSLYHDLVVSDTVIQKIHERTVNLKRIRQTIYDRVKITANLKDLEIPPGEIPPESFKFEVYFDNAEGQPSQDARLYFINPDMKDSTKFKGANGMYFLNNIKFNEKPYTLSFFVEDSSKLIDLRFIAEPEGISKFKFESGKMKPVTVSKAGGGGGGGGGGNAIPPFKPKIAKDSSQMNDNTQYTIEILNDKGEPLENVEVQFQSVLGFEKKRTNSQGKFLFPTTPIQDVNRFWQTKEGTDVVFRIKVIDPTLEPPNNESRTSLTWNKPKNPIQSRTISIQFNQKTRELRFNN